MASEPSHEVLVATLNELNHLLILPERLTIGKTKLGDGGFGEVCLATLDRLSRSPRKVAVKELRIPLAVRQRVAFRLARELKIWAKVKHPNLLELIGYHLSADCGCAQFVSTYMVNGNVMQYIQLSAASVGVRLKFVRDIATGLKYLHDFSPPICHGDLKPANVLVNESIDAVLCDFGLSSFICESGAATGLTTSKSVKGSTRYMSPELLLEEHSKHTLQSDVWAWGCTAFEIMTESIPYSTRTKDSAVILEIYKQSAPGSIDALGSLNSSTPVNADCHAGVSSLRSVIPQCWEFDPPARPSLSNILYRISAGSRATSGHLLWPRPGEDQETGKSSLHKEDRVNASQRVVDSSRVHSLRNGSEPSSLGMCKNCHKRPKFGSFKYCSRTCDNEAKRRANGGGGLLRIFKSSFWGGGAGDDGGAGRSTSQDAGRSTGGASYGAMPPAAGSGDNLCELRDCGGPSQGPYCSEKHAKKAVQKGEAQPCAYCKEYPANLPYKYCSNDCGMKDARERDRNASPLTLFAPDKKNHISIARRFQERWDDPIFAPPAVTAIYQINVSKKYERRFLDAVNAAERLGGSTTKSVFYGGQGICDLGVPQFGTDQLCSWESCSICIVIRKCFDVLEFKLPHHTGDLGKGIYANLSSAKANRFTNCKVAHPIRAMILCSIIYLDDRVQRDRTKYSAFIEDTGRVFCANNQVILPRQLILYRNPEPKVILQ